MLLKRTPPSSSRLTAGHASTEIPDNAIVFVQEEWGAGGLHSWADAPDLIEEHDDEDKPVEEGLEAFSYDPSGHSEGSDAKRSLQPKRCIPPE